MSSVRLALDTSVTCTAPAGEPPDEEGVDGAEGELALPRPSRRAPFTWSRSQRSFVAEKYGSRTRPVFSRTRGSCPSALSRGTVVGGAPVLPDDGVVERAPGAPVPQPRRLALVGDADRGDVAAAEPRLAERTLDGRDGRVSRCPRGRARPSRASGRSAGTPGSPSPAPRAGGRGSAPSCRSCPGRSRGRAKPLPCVTSSFVGSGAPCAGLGSGAPRGSGPPRPRSDRARRRRPPGASSAGGG